MPGSVLIRRSRLLEGYLHGWLLKYFRPFSTFVLFDSIFLAKWQTDGEFSVLFALWFLSLSKQFVPLEPVISVPLWGRLPLAFFEERHLSFNERIDDLWSIDCQSVNR